MSCLSQRLPAAIVFALILIAAPAVAQTPPALGPAPADQMPQPMPAPTMPAPLLPGDAFGEEVVMPARTLVFIKGHATWDTAFDTLVDAYKSLNEYLAKQGITPNGPALTVYTQTDDTGFNFDAGVPVAQAPANPPKGDIATGPAPQGKALKFVHRGSYDAMDLTYEAITNYLDEKRLEATDLFIEEYTTDPVKTDPDKLVVNVYVPVK